MPAYLVARRTADGTTVTDVATDGTEGAVVGNLYGTYLHGSLLPKNPALADELLLKALCARYGEEVTLAPLETPLEDQAHQKALTLR